MRRLLLLVASTLVLVAAVSAAVWTTNRKESPVPFEDAAVSPRVRSFESMKADGGSAIYVENQEAGSSVVSVGYAVMEMAGYVEIYADDGGHPGARIGTSAPLPSGGGEHVSVSLDVPLAAHEIYYAMLVDQGRKPITDSEGNIALMSFTALPGVAPETEAVQP